MDDLDRLYRRLVHNIRGLRPEYFQLPFTVRELYETVVPYRHNRRELAIETNDDYESAVARLLSGERGYVTVDPALQESLRRELASPTGDPGIFKEHGDTQIRLAPGAESARTPLPSGSPTSRDDADSVDTATSASAPASDSASTSAPAVTASIEAMTQAPSPSSTMNPVPAILDSLSSTPVPTGCRFCGGTLPEGRDLNYCPHCGENLRTKRCPACGSEMDSSWSFCVSCGRKGTP